MKVSDLIATLQLLSPDDVIECENGGSPLLKIAPGDPIVIVSDK